MDNSIMLPEATRSLMGHGNSLRNEAYA